MSDSLDLALKISAVDLAGGVLRRFRSRIIGAGKDAKHLQRDYDDAIGHIQAGLKSLALADYGLHKLKPAIDDAADLQESLLSVKQILQGAHPQAKLLADQMQRIKENSISVSRNMQYGATAVTDVTRQLYQGGVPLRAILDRKGPHGKLHHGSAYYVEALAETKNANPAEVAKEMANIGHAFQLRPSQYGPAVNTIAKALVTASGSLQDMFRDMHQIAAVSHMAGNTDLRTTALALKALSPLGEQSGSDLKAMVMSLEGTRRHGRNFMHKYGVDFYQGGKFIGLYQSVEKLGKLMKQMPSQEARTQFLGRLFRSGGLTAADALLMPSKHGVKSFPEIIKSYKNEASLEQQIAVRSEGFKMAMYKLRSTEKTGLAVLFTPMLKPLSEAVNLSDKLVGNVTVLASKHSGIANAASIGAGTALAGVGGYGIYRLLRAIGPGRRVLRGLGGIGKLATGVAEGKAVQAATGVAPVFVTNWPTGLGAAGAVAAGAEGKAAAGTVGGIIRKFHRLGPTLGEVGGMGLLGMAGSAAAVSGAGAAGYGLGREIYKHVLSGTALANAIGAGEAHVLAALGFGGARRALAANHHNALGGTLNIRITQDGHIKLDKLQKDGLLDFDVDTGPSMVMP